MATEVNGGNGYFSGKGYTRLPYLGNIKLAVHFTNILVNTDRQLAQGTVITEFDPTMRNIVDTGDVVETVGALGEAVGDLLEELFSQKEELLAQLSEAESFEEQQSIISQINDLEVTIDQQIDQIPNKENLPQELQDELQELKQEGSIVANNVLSPQEIADISTADAERRERIKEITAIAESGELDMVSDKIWFMPDWTPFKLAEDVSNTILQSGSQRIVGTVSGLRYNGTDYFARFSSDGNFEGYYIENTNDKADIPAWENLNEEAEVYLYQYLPNECNAIFKASFEYVDSLRSNIPYTQENENLTRVYISNCEDENDVYGQIEQPNSIIINIDGQSELITAAKQNQETPDEAFALNVRILDFAGITSASEKQELAQQMGSTRILEDIFMHYILTDNNTQPSLINEFLELVPDSGTYYRWIHFEDSGRVIINDKVPAGFDEALERAAYHWTQDYWDNLELNTNRGTRDFLFSYMLQTNMMLSIMADLLAEVQIAEKYWNAGDQANYVEQMEYVARLFAVLNGQSLNVFNAEQAQLQFAFYCGIFNGLMEELTGVVQLGELLTEYVTQVDSARAFDEGLNNINLPTLWSQFQTAHGLNGNGNLNQYVLAHQMGKDLVFVASLFIGIEEITSVSKAGQVLRNLENLADLAKLKKARRLKKLYPDGWNKLKTLTPLADNFWSKLDELGEAQGRFLADFDAQQLQRFVENPNLVDGWKKLDDLGDAIPDAIKRNPDVLGKTHNWSDDLYSKLGRVKDRNPDFFDQVNDNPAILGFFEEGSSILSNKADNLKAVELDMYSLDRAREFGNSLFEPGTTRYIQNTTRRDLAEMDINPQSGKIRDANGNPLNTDNVNGEGLMYVIDENDNIIIGGRGGIENSFPHPTLIGGTNPNVKSAGMIRFKGGRILEINNNSGHFKPSNSLLQEAEQIFRQKMPANSFDTGFVINGF